MSATMKEAPRIKTRAIYTVRECADGGGRPHFHVAAFGRDIVIGADRFTFATRAAAETEANRLSGVRANG